MFKFINFYKSFSKYDKSILEQDLKDFLKNLSVSNENDSLILNIPESNGNLAALVSSISAEKSKSVPWNFESPEFYFFKASSREAEIESFEVSFLLIVLYYKTFNVINKSFKSLSKFPKKSEFFEKKLYQTNVFKIFLLLKLVSSMNIFKRSL